MARRLMRRIGRIAARVALGLVLLVLALPLLATLALELPQVRELVRRRANLELQKALVGRLTLERLGDLGWSGVSGVDATVHDPAGKRVVSLRGLAVETFWPRIVWSALTGGNAIDVGIDAVRLDHAEIRVIDDGSGAPTLARAFQPKPSPAAPGPATELRLVLGRIELDHVWIHGALRDAPPIDAEIDDLRAKLRSESKGLTFELARAGVAVRALPERLEPRGTLSGRVEVPSRGGPRGSVHYAGTLAGAKLSVEGSSDGTNVRARIDAPDVAGVANARGLAVRDPTSLHVALDGTLEDLRLDAALSSRAVHLRLHGQGRIADESRVRATLDASDVDLSRLVRDGPSSALASKVELEVRRARDGVLDADYVIELPPGRVADETTPRIEARGKASQSPNGELALDGRVTIEESGAPIRADYRVRGRAGRLGVHAELDAKLSDPPRLAKLGIAVRGTLSATAAFDSTARDVQADAKVRLDAVRHELASARAVALNASLWGGVSDPRISAELTAGPVDAFGRHFRHVALAASGKPSRLVVAALTRGDAPERAELETTVSFDGATELEGLRVTLFGGEGPVELRAARVSSSSGRTRVEKLVITGAGAAAGELDLGTNRQRVELTAEELDIGRIARLVGVRAPFRRALVSADVALDRRGSVLSGRARARAGGIEMGRLRDARASVDLAFSPGKVSGTAEAAFGEGGRLHVELDDLVLPRGDFTASKLLTQRGSLSARGEFRLQGFLPLLQALKLPVERVAGTARFDFSASGGDALAGPRVEARLETKGLRLVERRAQPDPIRTPKEAREIHPRVLEDVDLRLLLDVEPKGRVARLDLELFDPYGTIVSLDGETTLPPAWPRTLASSWRTLPIRAHLEMPRRPLEIFPTLVRPRAAKGVAAVRLDVAGTALDPKLDVMVALDRLRVRQGDAPVRLAATSHYERARGTVSLEAETGGKNVALVEATWRGDAAKLATSQSNGSSPIDLDLTGELHDFPLHAVPALLDRQIKGPLSGTFELAGLGRDAELAVYLDASKITIGQVRMKRLCANVEARDGRARVTLEGGDNTGNAKIELETPLVWGDRLVPSAPKRATARLVARSFRVETLNPVLTRFLNEVGGRLDADVRMKLEPGQTELSGRASLRDGVVQIPALGQRLSGVTARASIEGDRVVIEDVSARGATGRLSARALARLDGLELVAAEAHVTIPERRKIPVTMQGAAVGDAWGRVAVLYRKEEDANEIRVDLRSLHVELAEQGDLEVQSLEEDDTIAIGARLADGTFTTIPVQPLEGSDDESSSSSPLRLRIRLGDDVEIKRGQMLTVRLRGELLMTSNGESQMTGRLELRGGKLDVQGKLFDIERGLVTFGGDPSNPTITATARWDSPVGYTVYAEYSGDVRNGKITLRSEPPLTQDEIASLLLFGDPEGSLGTGSGDTNSAATAVGVAGGTATKGINRALSDLTNLDVAARIDTSSGTARPEIVLQVSPRVTARVTRAVGEPQAGQPPDRTFLTFEFRFTRSWSLSAVIGDHGGSGMDVIWRRRY